MAGKQLKIMIIGLRGFPNVQGGIETGAAGNVNVFHEVGRESNFAL